MTGSIKPECRFIVGRQLEFELELKWLCSHLVPDTAAARRLLTLFCLPSRRRVWLAGCLPITWNWIDLLLEWATGSCPPAAAAALLFLVYALAVVCCGVLGGSVERDRNKLRWPWKMRSRWVRCTSRFIWSAEEGIWFCAEFCFQRNGNHVWSVALG